MDGGVPTGTAMAAATSRNCCPLEVLVGQVTYTTITLAVGFHLLTLTAVPTSSLIMPMKTKVASSELV